MNALSDIALEPKPRALVSPWADFWLVGGASGVAFVLFAIVTGVLGIDLNDSIVFWAIALGFVVNDPHFIYSYFLFYKGFLRRAFGPGTEFPSRVRHVVAGIAVPILMLMFLIFAFYSTDVVYVRWATVAMTGSVGWHYVKQGYGVLITLSLYENVFYSLLEKRILWMNGYVVWIASLLLFYARELQQTGNASHGVFGFTPYELQNFSFCLVGITSLVALAILVKHDADGKGTSCNGLTGYAAAVYMWMFMPFVNFAFYAIVPLFHSLQYLPFVYKYKKSELAHLRSAAPPRARKKAYLGAAIFAAGGIALGAIFFYFLPHFLDRQAAAANAGLHPSFFFLMFLAFINIHHFFMDSAFWRRDNAGVQQNLFRA